jgi:hypothetical protein
VEVVKARIRGCGITFIKPRQNNMSKIFNAARQQILSDWL